VTSSEYLASAEMARGDFKDTHMGIYCEIFTAALG
jgi:hypothetical protein